MTIKVLNEFLPNAEIQRLGAVKVGDTLEITQDEGVLNVDPTSVVSAYYSNIITEIAQDIKLELNDGILMLKAGSKVYVPNGADVFDSYISVVDKSVTNSTNGQHLVFTTKTFGYLSLRLLSNCSSGSSATASTYSAWYDTVSNKIKYTSSGTVWIDSGEWTLPIALVTVSGGVITSIDQVFNGAGYIGHHAFILPGLKGMAPDGLSDKGYVKNVDIEVNKVLVYDLASAVTDFNNSFLFLNPLLEIVRQYYNTVDRAKELVRTTDLIQYAYQENKDYAWNGTTYINPINLPIVECSLKDSAVTYFRILQPLRMATVSDIKESTDSFLFDYKWADHNPNKVSWLRADTFSWQDGATYKSAYKHLVEDFNGTTSATETIGSNTITYYLATDKHKIVLPDQESIVQAIYNETGIAWYYILDTANTRFKLPRTKFGFVGIRDGVGNYVTESLPNITGHSCLKQNDNDGNPTGAFYRTNSNAYTGFNSSAGHFIDFDASRSSSTYQDNAPVQQRATQMYLYCYVGRANQDALEKSEIDIVALTNSSINQITSTKNTSLTEINTATEEGINRLNTDSNALNRTQITNCITEIPQDIKLELNNEILTLKAGSKVYIPNGVGKFDAVNIETDRTVPSNTLTGNFFVFASSTALFVDRTTIQSGSTPPSSVTVGAKFYNTTENKIYRYDGTEWQPNGYSLPLAVITLSSGKVTSIDQVFNGFSYIGSTVFTLPGVKGLIPNGRNADGTLRNIKFEATTVRTSKNTGSGRDWFVYSSDNFFNRVPSTAYKFDIDKNRFMTIAEGTDRLMCVCGTTAGDITSFTPKATFRAADYSDFKAAKDDIIALSANKQDTITDLDTIRLGASKGATAVQPATLTEYRKATEQDIIDTEIRNSIPTNNNQLTNGAGYITSSTLTGYHDSTKQDKLTAGANIDITNNVISATGGELGYSQISNCITEIPQDIKLELNNGTLTLKAGSKCYIPNGTGIFDVLTIQSDKVVDCGSATGKTFVRVYPNQQPFGDLLVSFFYSIYKETGTNMYYNTETNKITYCVNGVSDENICSFPIAEITVNNGQVTSIDQVFNGFGYIGSTVFILPGVKGLIPNGRNADGSLKNIKYNRTSVRVDTFGDSGYIGPFNLYCFQLFNGFQTIYYYDEKTNTMLSNYFSDSFISGIGYITNGRITSFQPKTTFHAVDYNDKAEVIGWGIPDYSAGISISSGYVAVSNGMVKIVRGGGRGAVSLYVDGVVVDGNYSNTTNEGGCLIAFVKKSSTVTWDTGNIAGTPTFFPCIGG